MAGGPGHDSLSDHVHQASGMVAVQAGCDVTKALALLIVRAAETEQSLEDLSLDVIDRMVSFAE
jgi:hypothetical protein